MPDQSTQPSSERRGSVTEGLALALFVNVGAFAILSAASSNFVAAHLAAAFGLSQLLWVVPACWYFRKQRETAQGILAIAVVTFIGYALLWRLSGTRSLPGLPNGGRVLAWCWASAWKN